MRNQSVYYFTAVLPSKLNIFTALSIEIDEPEIDSATNSTQVVIVELTDFLEVLIQAGSGNGTCSSGGSGSD